MLLCLRDVQKARARDVGYRLHIRSLTVCEGEHVAITGPSGCGKSTTLDILGMVLKPDSADSFVLNAGGRDMDVAALWAGKGGDAMAMLRKRHLGYVLQTGELLPFLNVRENIELTAHLAGTANGPERAARLMEELGIMHLAASMPATLSIGERQRAAIARALAHAPCLLLADEPTAALDPMLSRTVMRLFLQVARQTGAAIVMVSHDIALVREFGFREAPFAMERDGSGILAVLDDGSGEREAAP